MNNIIDSYNQAELALAAYATLMLGIPSVDELKRDTVGMSNTEAQHFSENWLVIAPTFVGASGISATLFQNKLTGEISLAIRGTEPTLTDIGADGLLAIGISSKLNPQFTALKTQIDAWLAPGGLLNN